eukprot:gene27095-3508_t
MKEKKEKKSKKEKKEKKKVATTAFCFGAPLEDVDDKVSSLFSAAAAVPQPLLSGQLLPEREHAGNTSSSDEEDEDGDDGNNANANPLAWMGGTFGMNAGQETAAAEASKSKAKAVVAAAAAAAATARYEGREEAKKAKAAAKKRSTPEEDLNLPQPTSKRQKKIADRASRSKTAQLYPVSVSNISHKCKRKHLETIFSAKVEVAGVRLVARPVGDAAAAAAGAAGVGGGGGGGGSGQKGGQKGRHKGAASDDQPGAYVMFFSQRAADIALGCDGTELQGKKIRVLRADGSKFAFCNSKESSKDADVEDSSLIMVTNLPMDIDAKQALKLFKGCGAVVGHKLEKKEAKQKVFFYLLFAAVKA